MTTGTAQDENPTSPADAPESRKSAPLAATSQGFYPPPEPAVLRRSLILSASASMFGMIFFAIIQGTVFNFLLEDFSLRDRLPYFQALWCIGGVGNMGCAAGSGYASLPRRSRPGSRRSRRALYYTTPSAAPDSAP